jgi:dUTP pyrophosphatase
MQSQVTVLNSPGTIDSDYRGEIYVRLINHGPVVVTLKPGERIAQLVFCPVFTVEFEETKELSITKRGQNGLGSTGK